MSAPPVEPSAESGVTIRPVGVEDRPALDAVLSEHWGSARVVTRGRLYDALACAGFVAWEGDERVGFLTYRIDGHECEILTLNSLRPRRGIGRRLVAAAVGIADRHRCRRVWLVTTNDNVSAQGFWRRVGFSLARVHRGAMTASRRIKPEIPEFGEGGAPITDELEFERFIGAEDAEATEP